jgi:hypothetical protein
VLVSETAARSKAEITITMSIHQYKALPQAFKKAGTGLSFVDGELLSLRAIARDPLTNDAYFDARVLTPFLAPKTAEKRRFDGRSVRHVELHIHADMLKAKAIYLIGGLSPTNGGGGLRGTVRGFSKASRKRMIEFMAMARVRGHMLFATFTYPDEFPIGQPEAWNAHFEALRRRIERKYPDYAIIWREELQVRKSGANRGKIAPHFHMIIDTAIEGCSVSVSHTESYGRLIEKTVSSASEEFEAWALQAWAEIVGAGDEKHLEHGCFVVACRNKKHAYKYISKYVAKQETDEFEVGRRWGRIGSWDISESWTCVISQAEYIELKRLFRQVLRKRFSKFWRPFSQQSPAAGATFFGLGDASDMPTLVHKAINAAAIIRQECPHVPIPQIAVRAACQ